MSEPWDLEPVTETRECDKCGAFTWWAGPRQRTKGRCLDCAGVPPEGEDSFDRALALLLDAFPGSTIEQVRARRYAPDGYHGPGAGPCRGCGATIRLYGDEGSPFCTTCRPRGTT